MNLLPIPLLEIFINSREAERYLSKPDFALVYDKNHACLDQVITQSMAASQPPLRNLRARLLVVGFLVKKNRFCLLKFSCRRFGGPTRPFGLTIRTGQLRRLANAR
jgi:hypothetical protein